MCYGPTLRRVPLIAVCAVLFAPAIHAQLPRRLERCLSYPTFADEIKDAIKEAQSYPKVHIDAVAFEGADHVAESVKAQITRRLKEPTYDNDSGWIDYCQEAVTEALKERGYILARVIPNAHVLSGDQREVRVAVTFQVHEGQQYRLSEIHFINAHVFPPENLRKHFPLQDGDVFDITRIRKGIEGLTRVYDTQGYLNFTASPNLRFDDENKRISLVIDLNEDRQFRVEGVEVFGLDRRLWGPTLRTKLVPGQVFNPVLAEDVFTENKAALPADASSGDYIQITQNIKKATVVIEFDFAPCN